jgi:GTPase
VADAHLILHVVDGNDPHLVEQMTAVDEVLGEIGADEAPRLLVFNKADLLEPDTLADLREQYPDALFASAVTGLGIEALVERLAFEAAQRDERLHVLLPYDKGALLSDCHKFGHIISEEYVERGTLVEAVVPVSLANRIRPFVVAE